MDSKNRENIYLHGMKFLERVAPPPLSDEAIVAAWHRQLHENPNQPYHNFWVANHINSYIDQKGFTINIDYNNFRRYHARMFQGYRIRIYPSWSDNIQVFMREIPLDWIPSTGNELLRQILIHYMLLSREEFKSWQARQNWERYNSSSPDKMPVERIVLSEEEEREIPTIKFEQQFQTTTNIHIEKLSAGNAWEVHNRMFVSTLLDKGNDLIPGFTGIYIDENDDKEYDLRYFFSTNAVKPERREQRMRQAIAQNELIENLYLAFFKDLTHWIIFILCKINKREVEPVPIKNNIISANHEEHIDIYKNINEERNIKSSWCYHIKPNENLFYRSFKGSIITKEREVTYDEFIAAKKRLEFKEKAAKKRLEFKEKGKKLVKDARKRQNAKENVIKAGGQWVRQRGRSKCQKKSKCPIKGKKKKLMDDNIILKF